MATRAAVRVLFGVELDQHQQQPSPRDEGLSSMGADLADYADGLFALPIALPGTAFYTALCAKKRLHETLRKLLQQKQQRQQFATRPYTSDDDDVTSGPSDDIFTDILRATCFSSGGLAQSAAEQPEAADDPRRLIAETTTVDQALELLFGGQETLACLVTCLIMVLAPPTDATTHDDDEVADGEQLGQGKEEGGGEGTESCRRGQQPVFDKMFAEVAASGCGGNHGDDDGTEIDIDRLEYVGAVVKETLRLYSPIGGGYRHALHSFDIGGFSVPRGWSVTYSIKSTHDLSPLFADRRDSFLPERWFSLPAGDGRSTTFDYLPFGAGARRCVGSEYATLFARLFCVELARMCAGWQLSATTSRPVEMMRVPVVRPKEPMYAVFQARSSPAQ
jgi:cytochrome P450